MATGKIARLSREVREQLNRRLENGEPGKRLVVWLNELPEVKALLTAEFGGAVVNEQNLSNWKQGGYRDWVTERRVESWGGRLAGEKRSATSEQLLTLYTVRYLVMARDWAREKEGNPRRCMRKWRVLGQDIMKLRQSEHRAERLELDWERLEFSQERFEDKKQTDERRAMIGFLVAARQWPEVSAALAGAFRLFREKKGQNKDGGLKVEDGEPPQAIGGDAADHTVKMGDGLSSGVAGCQSTTIDKRGSRGRSPHHAIVPSRGSLNLPGRCPALLPTLKLWRTSRHGIVMGANRTELESIKVNQGGIFKKRGGAEQTTMENRGWKIASHKVSRSERDKICRSATDATWLGVMKVRAGPVATFPAIIFSQCSKNPFADFWKTS